jgi:hypothetical protein
MGTKQSGVQLPTPDSEGAELLLSELLKSNPISVQPADPVKKAEFIKQQYAQYWEMLRQHTTLSWQIPALSTAAIVFFLGIDPSRILEWSKTPFMPAVVFIILGSFVGIMFIHHRRNILFIGFYENAIKEIEKEYGLEMQVHHS